MKGLAWTVLWTGLGVVGCGGPGLPAGYLKSDVAEPGDMENPMAENIRLQGPLFQEGTLTYEGGGTIQEVFLDYIDRMQRLGWAPFNTQQDPEKGMSAKLVKDIRVAELSVTPGETDDVKVIIRVGPNHQK